MLYYRETEHAVMCRQVDHTETERGSLEEFGRLQDSKLDSCPTALTKHLLGLINGCVQRVPRRRPQIGHVKMPLSLHISSHPYLCLQVCNDWEDFKIENT